MTLQARKLRKRVDVLVQLVRFRRVLLPQDFTMVNAAGLHVQGQLGAILPRTFADASIVVVFHFSAHFHSRVLPHDRQRQTVSTPKYRGERAA